MKGAVCLGLMLVLSAMGLTVVTAPPAPEPSRYPVKAVRVEARAQALRECREVRP